MAHSKVDKHIVSEISKYRTICLIHRFLYYVKCSPLITDLQYDILERKLKALVTQHPGLAFEADHQAFCPATNVGSDNPDDYPRRVEQLADSLLAYKGDHGKARADVSDVSILPSTISPGVPVADSEEDWTPIQVPTEA